MYEIRRQKNMFNIFDTNNGKYVGYTRYRKHANRVVQTLKNKGFEGEIPQFFLVEKINFDRMHLTS